MGDLSTAGDGRLELDDLGGIIDRSTSLDGPSSQPVELLEGAEGPTLAERLESAGITPWLRRHRVALAAATAVVVLAAAGATAYVRTRPVPDDGVIAVTMSDADPSAPAVFDSTTGLFHFDYTAQAERPGETVTVLGLGGPGIRASSAAGVELPAGGATSTVTVVPGCDDPALTKPSWADYHVQVRRTDVQGRVADGVVALAAGSAAQWPTQLLAYCVQAWLSERVTTGEVTVASDQKTMTVTLDAAVHSGLDHPVYLQLFSQGDSMQPQENQSELPGHATTHLPLSFTMNNCGKPAWEFGHDPNTGMAFNGMNIYAGYSDPDIPQDYARGFITLSWDTATQQRIQSSIDSLCTGVPRLGWQVTSARQVSNLALAAAATSGRGVDSPVVLRTTIAVTTKATSVSIGDTLSARDLEQGAQPVVTTASSAVRGGRATVTVDWVASCAYATNPPVLSVTVRSGGRDWPLRLTLDAPRLAKAYLAACPQLTSVDLQGAIWTLDPSVTSGSVISVTPSTDPGVVPVPSY